MTVKITTPKRAIRGVTKMTRGGTVEGAAATVAASVILGSGTRLTIGGQDFVMVPVSPPTPAERDEDADDRALLAAAAAESAGHPLIPGDVVDRLIAGENPIKVFREWRETIHGERYNQAGLAKALEVSQSYMSDVESGKKQATPALYKSIAELLGVALDLIMPDETHKVWKLTPRHLEDNDWRASPRWQKPIVVRAPTEEAARWAASFAFHDATIRVPGQTLPINPWRQERLVTAETIAPERYSPKGPIAILEPAEHNDEIAGIDWSQLRM